MSKKLELRKDLGAISTKAMAKKARKIRLSSDQRPGPEEEHLFEGVREKVVLVRYHLHRGGMASDE